MKWSNIVEKAQKKAYVLPPGWDTREKVAEDLGCAAERVKSLLAPAIKQGTVITDVFTVYDTVAKKLVRVTAYKEVNPNDPQKPKK